MISNHPSMVGHQEFQAQHSDMLAAARASPPITVEASNQSGCALVVHPLSKALDVGTVFTIAGVDRYRLAFDDCVPVEFIVTRRAEVGHTVIFLYPPIETPSTVNHLPIRGAVVTVKRNLPVFEPGVTAAA